MTIGPKAPVDALDGFVRGIDSLAQRLADLERANARHGAIPIGGIVATIAATAPPGFLMLDGSTITNGQTLYPALWSVIPAGWKSGANIVLPDARGRAIIGAGQGSGLTDRALSSTGGSENATLVSHSHGGGTGWQSADHVHATGWADRDHTHNEVGWTGSDYHHMQEWGSGADVYTPSGTISVRDTAGQSQSHTHGNTGGVSANHYHGINAEGSSATNANMPPYIALNWLVRT